MSELHGARLPGNATLTQATIAINRRQARGMMETLEDSLAQ